MKTTMTLAALAALALAGCKGTSGGATAAATPAGGAPIAAPKGTDWVSTTAQTPDGGWRMGNPDAPVKLVEYGSLTCPHCAHFSKTGMADVRRAVATGRMSYEYRSYLLHGQDLAATALVGCAGPQSFFGLLEAAYAAQEEWLDKLVKLPEAELKRMSTLPIAQQNAEVARAAGLDEFVVQRGVPREKVGQCLADPALADRLQKVRDTANTTYNIPGTPTFLINGKVVEEVADWAGLQPKLKDAGL